MNTEYRNRHIGHSDAERDQMLAELGYESVLELMDDALPSVRSQVNCAPSGNHRIPTGRRAERTRWTQRTPDAHAGGSATTARSPRP